MPHPSTIRLLVTLEDVAPPIWRRLVVPDDLTLEGLHRVLQIVMGWEDHHLYRFAIDETEYGDPDLVRELDYEIESVWRWTLRDVVPGDGDAFLYEYDLGDSWRHRVEVEAVEEPGEDDGTRVVCLDGARSAPPEDCGGHGGYAELLEALDDSGHPEHEEWAGWVGPEFEPEAFDPEEVNARLAQQDDLPTGFPEEALEVLDALDEAAGADSPVTERLLAFAEDVLIDFARTSPGSFVRARKPGTLAGGAVHAAGQLRLPPYDRPAAETVADVFGVSTASISSRSLEIRDALGRGRRRGIGGGAASSGAGFDAFLGFLGVSLEVHEAVRAGMGEVLADALAGLEPSAPSPSGRALPEVLADPRTGPEEKDAAAVVVAKALAAAAADPLSEPVPHAALAVERLASRGLLADGALAVALDLALEDPDALAGCSVDDLRPLCRGVATDAELSIEARAGALLSVVETAGEGGDTRLPPELVDAIARDDDISVELRRAFVGAASGESEDGPEPGPWFPTAARRRALFHRIELDREPLDALETLLATAEDERSTDHWVAAAEYVEEHGGELSRSRMETLVRRGLDAHYAEARQAFYRAGRRHLGSDVREWAPDDVLKRARKKGPRRGAGDPDQITLL